MTTLSENMKTIRKNLKCTQMAMARVLDIGFRTYVRYEAGERDAPVAVLVKFARLANISLDRLLTTKLEPSDLELPDLDPPPGKLNQVEVIGGSIKEGRLIFKGIRGDYYVAVGTDEKKLLTHFRKMNQKSQDKCLVDMEWALKKSKGRASQPGKKKVSRKVEKTRNANRLKKMAKTIKKITLKG
ncbi:MAG: helix-turn-helix transcriptional regulator [Nitrospinae bacterium]|nr:helix-turn-helix transcriptional regulator [Nitrospinota bacterium]